MARWISVIFIFGSIHLFHWISVRTTCHVSFDWWLPTGVQLSQSTDKTELEIQIRNEWHEHCEAFFHISQIIRLSNMEGLGNSLKVNRVNKLHWWKKNKNKTEMNEVAVCHIYMANYSFIVWMCNPAGEKDPRSIPLMYVGWPQILPNSSSGNEGARIQYHLSRSQFRSNSCAIAPIFAFPRKYDSKHLFSKIWKL